MNDWYRSLTVLGAGFAGVVAFTLGLAMVIVPGPDILDISGATGEVRTQVGGTLTVSGDRQAIFALNDEVIDRRYGLEGDDGGFYFAEDPLAVEQINFDGLSFFPEPDDCTITEGEFHAASGVATVGVLCADIADIRGNGVVTFEGAIGLAASLTDVRGDLPPTGGSVDVGDEALVFTDATLLTGPRFRRGVGENPYRMELYDPDADMMLSFTYDWVETQLIALANITHNGDPSAVPDDACAVSTREVGPLGPSVTLIELSLECTEVDISGLGPVTISGSLFVEQTEAAY